MKFFGFFIRLVGFSHKSFFGHIYVTQLINCVTYKLNDQKNCEISARKKLFFYKKVYITDV